MASVIWSLGTDEFRNLVASKTSYADVLRHFGLVNKGGNTKTVKRRIQMEGVSVSHFSPRHEKIRCLSEDKCKLFPLEKVLVEKSTYRRTSLKRRLIDMGILHNKCSECGLSEKWNGKPIVMTLDHINGVCDDNRLENLRLLCPNCNSQQPTFAGRNVKGRITKRHCSCGNEITRWSKTGNCFQCARDAQRKSSINKPNLEDLRKTVAEIGCTGAGKKYNVQRQTIYKWLKSPSSSLV